MATKTVKEITTDVGGNVSVEYSDDSTSSFNLANTVTAVSNPVTGGITLISKLTQAEYDALAVKDASTLYVIVAA